MSPENKVVYLRNTTGSGGSAEQDIHHQIRTLVLDRLTPALATMLDNADDALFERADKAENSQDQGSFFMAMRQLRLGRRDLEGNFRAALQNGFEHTRSISPAPQPKTVEADSDLSLVDNETLEESIAIDSMIAKARTRDALLLEHSLIGLNALLPNRTITEHNNPLDPAAIVGAFVDSATSLELELAPRLVIYKLFDKYVLTALTDLYKASDELLVKAGLRTPRSYTARPSTGGARSASQRATASTATPPLTAQEAAPLLDGLRQLLAWEHGATSGSVIPSSNTAAPGDPQVSLSDLMSALSVMQRESDVGATPEQDVKQTLGHILSLRNDQHTQIGALEDAAIDIVSLLFDVIMDDSQLPTSIKALIARLQIPVLKVALLDGALFSSKRHPARRLINTMAQAAIGWVEPAQVERDPLYRQIDNVVERVLGEFDDNVDLFEHLLEEFQLFLEEERERARLVEERTRQAAEGKAKVDNARLRVEAEIQQRVSGLQLPPVIHQLLDDAWSKVLFLSFLKEDDDGSEWRQQLAVVDRLIASVEPKRTQEARRTLLTEIPLLLHDLREGLNAIMFNPFDMTRLFKQLEMEHVRCLTADKAETEPPFPVAAEKPTTAEVPPVQPPQPISDELAEYVQRLDQASIGTWFEFMQKSGSRIRAKLSARLNDGQQLIFVNRSGFKMADRSLEELAKDLHDGKVIMLDDNLLFDKALETVVTNLRNLRAEA